MAVAMLDVLFDALHVRRIHQKKPHQSFSVRSALVVLWNVLLAVSGGISAFLYMSLRYIYQRQLHLLTSHFLKLIRNGM